MTKILELLLKFLPANWKVPLQLLVLMFQTEQAQEALKGSLKLAKVLAKLKTKYTWLAEWWTELEPDLVELVAVVKRVVNRIKVIRNGPPRPIALPEPSE